MVKAASRRGRRIQRTPGAGGERGSCPVSLLARPLVPRLAGRCFHSVMQQTEAPLQRSAVGLYTARVPRQSRPGAVRFDVEMIVVANGQFASRSGRPMADRTCTANANKVDPGCPLSLSPGSPLQPPRALSVALAILPSLALRLSGSVGPRYTRPRYTNSHL